MSERKKGGRDEKNDFRTGDKVFYYNPGSKLNGKATVTEVSDGVYIDEHWCDWRFLTHDHDRKISAAVQKTIEENETKPVRKSRSRVWIS